MKRLPIAGLTAAAALVAGIASVAAAPASSAATGPSVPPSTLQRVHQAEIGGASHGLRSGGMAAADVTTSNTLLGVSCYSNTMCVSVGADYADATPIAEMFNGGGWATNGAVPVPSGTTASYLQSVSCRSTTFCVAVGGYNTGSSSSGNLSGAGLAEIWDGSTDTWSDVKDLTGSGADTGLTGVSCVNTHQCVTVGVVSSDGNSGTPVADTWNGSTWTRTPTPKVPGGAFLTSLTGIACWTGTNCIASGYYITGTESAPTGEGPLAEEWNGSTWTIIRPPTTGLQSWLDGIQCLNASTCMAVGGYYKTSTHFVGFAEQWNGKSWKALLSSSLATQGDSELLSVSCLSSGDCNAGGIEQIDINSDTLQNTKAAAVHWNGSTLGLTSPAGLSGEDDGIYGVSCKANNFCSATGSYGPVNSNFSADVSWFWNSTKWKLVSAV
jgi:hypothetical protein